MTRPGLWPLAVCGGIIAGLWTGYGASQERQHRQFAAPAQSPPLCALESAPLPELLSWLGARVERQAEARERLEPAARRVAAAYRAWTLGRTRAERRRLAPELVVAQAQLREALR